MGLSEVPKFQHYTKACFSCSISLFRSSLLVKSVFCLLHVAVNSTHRETQTSSQMHFLYYNEKVFWCVLYNSRSVYELYLLLQICSWLKARKTKTNLLLLSFITGSRGWKFHPKHTEFTLHNRTVPKYEKITAVVYCMLCMYELLCHYPVCKQ